MYALNKIVWFFMNPMTLLLMLAAAGLLVGRRRRRLGGAIVVIALAALWFASTTSCVALLGLPLERRFLACAKAESSPAADAIVVLGGGVGKTIGMEYPDLFEAADRLWHAARLWKLGKAPVVVLAGSGDEEAAVPLLVDLGVRRDAIVCDGGSRNTYENSRFTERLLEGRGRRILLVTSAWHMPRALGNFAKTGLEAIPAPSDFSANNAVRSVGHWWDWISPSADSLARTSYLLKEWVGRFARR